MVAHHLESIGWQIVARNWRFSRVGELDIVAVDPGGSGRGTLVFCEVKTRSGDRFGQPMEAITTVKLRTLRKLACAWIATHEMDCHEVRIDAIGVMARPGAMPQIVHIRGVGQ